jgi:ribosomal protection tetracycline resistance protein
VEVPIEAVGAVMPALARLGAAVETPSLQADMSTIHAVLAATRADDLQRQLAGLTGGEGVLESHFAGYQPVTGEQPTRRRITPNPLNVAEYVRHLAGR